MSVLLNAEQRAAISKAAGRSIYVTDPDTGDAYVLIRADAIELARPPATEDDFDIRDTYAAQSEVAAASGWNDPIMDEYDNYDFHRRRLAGEQ